MIFLKYQARDTSHFARRSLNMKQYQNKALNHGHFDATNGARFRRCFGKYHFGGIMLDAMAALPMSERRHAGDDAINVVTDIAGTGFARARCRYNI